MFDFCNVCQCSCCYLLGVTNDSKNPLVLDEWSVLVTSGFHLFYLSTHFCCIHLLWIVHCKASMAWKPTQIIFSMCPYVAESRPLARRREAGTNASHSVQIYQCHAFSKILHVQACFCRLRVVSRDSDHTLLGLRPWGNLGILSSQSLRLCLCHQVLQNLYFIFLHPLI